MDKLGQRGGLNETSLVLSLGNGDNRVLIMGDVEVVAERDLLDKSTLTEEIRVLVAGHHASKNTSSAELLRHVSPSLSVISLDEDNIRGYPHPDTVKRLEQYSERVHRTWNRDVVVSLD